MSGGSVHDDGDAKQADDCAGNVACCLPNQPSSADFKDRGESKQGNRLGDRHGRDPSISRLHGVDNGATRQRTWVRPAGSKVTQSFNCLNINFVKDHQPRSSRG